MTFKMFNPAVLSALYGLSILTPVIAVPAPAPAFTCNADNCLRAFRAASPSTKWAKASSSCSSYLSTSVPAITTVTSSTASTPTTATVTGSEVLVTSTIDAVTTTTVTGFALQQLTKREAFQVTRSAGTFTPTSTFHAYALQCSGLGTTSVAARVSSACFCLLASPATVTTTAASVVTETATTPMTVSIPTSTSTIITTSYTSTSTVTVAPAGPVVCTSNGGISLVSNPTPGTQRNILGVANAALFRSFGGVLSTAQCAFLCLAFTGCLSFQYNDVNSAIKPDYCTLFVTSVARDQVDNSPSQVALGYHIFDLGYYYCPAPAVTATSSAAP